MTVRPLVAAALLALLGGCGTEAPLYTSAPGASETTVDGDARDWPAALRPVPREAGLSLGLRNTADALYVVVVASDERQARRVALGGLRLWLDPTGGTERVLGLRFPSPPPPDPSDVRRERGRARNGGVDEQQLRRRFDESVQHVEITRKGQVLVQSVPRGSVEGLETEARWTRAGLVVEARIPLDAASGLLATNASGRVGLGVELIDLAGFMPVGPRGRGPARGGEDGEGRPAAPQAPAAPRDAGAEPATLTRWLRADLSE